MAKITGAGRNKFVSPSVKAGPPRTNIVSPASTNQLGASVAFKPDPLPIGTASQVPLGNAVALNSKSAPGQGRTVQKSGSQGLHGPVAGAPRPMGPDILSQYGPEKGKG
jgi:hypothetical protein